MLAYLKNQNNRDLKWYEVISEAAPATFHLDVEVGVVVYSALERAPALLRRLDFLQFDENTQVCLCDVGLCHVIICYTMLCHVMLQYVFLTRCNPQDDIAHMYGLTVALPWEQEQCQEAYTLVTSALPEFLALQFPKEEFNPIVMSSYRPEKFSLHDIVPTLVLDANYLSCSYLSWEFSR